MYQKPSLSEILSILPSGRYEILRPLGHGAFGQVFEGLDCETGVPLVLKVLSFQNKNSYARVKREVDLARLITSSPQVSPLLASYFSPDSRIAVLVYKFFEGQTLDQLVESSGRVPTPVAAAIGRQICKGLNHLHLRNIIHRDIKPSNIFITSKGEVKLLDFGIAVSTNKPDPESSITQDITHDGDFVGTIRYAPPETFHSRPPAPSNDIYSFGVTLLFMLLGRQPLENASFPVLIKAASTAGLASELPQFLVETWGEIITSSLNIDPTARPSPSKLIAKLQLISDPSHENDVDAVEKFISSHQTHPKISSNVSLELDHLVTDGRPGSLKEAVEALATQMYEMQAAVSDMTLVLKKQNLLSPPPTDRPPPTPEERLEATFLAVRGRLEWNWKIALFMTIVLFALVVVMFILAVLAGLLYKSHLGWIFGSAGGLSLVAAILWKPMDKMLFATVAAQQLELIQLNYQRAMGGSREERREAFKDVSTQLTKLLMKADKSNK